MIYTAEEKRKLDAMIEQNREYIKGQHSWEILFSDQSGYMILFWKRFGRFEGRILKNAKELEQLIEDSIKLDRLAKELGEKTGWIGWYT